MTVWYGLHREDCKVWMSRIGGGGGEPVRPLQSLRFSDFWMAILKPGQNLSSFESGPQQRTWDQLSFKCMHWMNWLNGLIRISLSCHWLLYGFKSETAQLRLKVRLIFLWVVMAGNGSSSLWKRLCCFGCLLSSLGFSQGQSPVYVTRNNSVSHINFWENKLFIK